MVKYISKINFLQAIIFGSIGVLNTLIDILLFTSLTYIFKVESTSFYIYYINIFAFFVASLNSYFLNKYFTFKKKNKSTHKEYIKFLIISLISLFVNTISLKIILDILDNNSLLDLYFINGISIFLVVAKIFATIVTMSINYIGYKKFVFTSSNSKKYENEDRSQ